MESMKRNGMKSSSHGNINLWDNLRIRKLQGMTLTYGFSNIAQNMKFYSRELEDKSKMLKDQDMIFHMKSKT